MTQSPYVPPRDDDNSSTRYDSDWSAPQDGPATEEQKDAELFASQFPEGSAEPAHTEAVYTDAVYSEPVSTYVSTDANEGRPQPTKDVARDEAANVKDTAVEKGQQVAGVAKEQAANVKDTAVEKGQQVAEVAKEQASKVASEAGSQIKDLLADGLSEVRSQAGSQQRRLAAGIHSLASELGGMASKSDQSGPLTDLAHQASRKGGEVAHWLETAEPSELLEQVKSFARRRPVVFLAAAALAGVLAGRLTRGAVAVAKDESDSAAISAAPAYPPVTSRENISLQEIPTSGTGQGPTTDAPDYVDPEYRTNPSYTDPQYNTGVGAYGDQNRPFGQSGDVTR